MGTGRRMFWPEKWMVTAACWRHLVRLHALQPGTAAVPVSTAIQSTYQLEWYKTVLTSETFSYMKLRGSAISTSILNLQGRIASFFCQLISNIILHSCVCKVQGNKRFRCEKHEKAERTIFKLLTCDRKVSRRARPGRRSRLVFWSPSHLFNRGSARILR